MEVGLYIGFGKQVPGREQHAIDLFAEAIEFYGKKMAEGVITYFEPFLFQSGGMAEETGFFVMKGPVAEVFKLMEDDEYITLLDKAYYLVEHLKVELLWVGDGINEQLVRTAKVRAELGI